MPFFKSLIFFFILVNISITGNAQNGKQDPITINEENTSEFRIVPVQLNFINSPNYNSYLNLIKSDKISYSTLNTQEAYFRFNQNFMKVDPLIFAGTGKNNLSLIRRGYEPHYQNPYNQRTFAGELILGILENCFIKI